MTDQQLIITVAKLDGWTFSEGTFSIGVTSPEGNTCTGNINAVEVCMELCQSSHRHEFLTSHDVIIPVIEKIINTMNLKWMFITRLAEDNELELSEAYADMFELLLQHPRQLSIALVKATGKWEE